MSPIIVVLVVVGVVWVAQRVSDSFGDWCARVLDQAVSQRIEARVARLREEASRSCRPPGTQPEVHERWRAGGIDGAAAMAGALVITFVVGLSEVTEFSPGDGSSSSHLEEHFSTPLFLLLTVVAYAASAWRAGRSTHKQSFGQRLFDYAPRRVDGADLTSLDVLKRTLLRLAAAPSAAVAASQGRLPTFEHDAWCGTEVGYVVDTATEQDEMQEVSATVEQREVTRSFTCSACDASFSTRTLAEKHALREHVVDSDMTVTISKRSPASALTQL